MTVSSPRMFGSLFLGRHGAGSAVVGTHPLRALAERATVPPEPVATHADLPVTKCWKSGRLPYTPVSTHSQQRTRPHRPHGIRDTQSVQFARRPQIAHGPYPSSASMPPPLAELPSSSASSSSEGHRSMNP